MTSASSFSKQIQGLQQGVNDPARTSHVNTSMNGNSYAVQDLPPDVRCKKLVASAQVVCCGTVIDCAMSEWCNSHSIS